MSAGVRVAFLVLALAATSVSAVAQQPARPAGAPAPPAGAITPPDDYVIGASDILTIQFWRDESMSGDALVRPDGKITLRLLNDVHAAGLTTEELRLELEKLGSKHLREATVTVGVKQINSRKVTVVGEVNKQGPIPLLGPMTVIEAIGLAGGLTEFADGSKIRVLRTEKGAPTSIRVDYKAIVSEGKKLEQNILLRPNDQIVVPD